MPTDQWHVKGRARPRLLAMPGSKRRRKGKKEGGNKEGKKGRPG